MRLPAVSKSLRALTAGLAIFRFLAKAGSVQAGPFEDFFRKVRNAFVEPDKKTSSHHPSQKPNHGEVVAASNRETAAGKNENGPPNELNTRTTPRVKTTRSKSEFKYGTPVPGRNGLVTSPFSPDAGYIDVRGFPPGTPVKDPYSGKIFLTP